MKGNLEHCIDVVFGHEGGYVNHPKDPGGPTKFGITAKTLGAWRKIGRAAMAAEVKALTLPEAATILDVQYARTIRFDALPSGVDLAVFDFSVNSGPSQAAKSLQRVLGVSADGVIGEMTLQALRDRRPSDIVDAYCDERLRFLQKLDNWPTFGKGWKRRVGEIRLAAKAMASHRTVVPPVNAPETAKAPATSANVSSTKTGKGALATAAGSIATGVGQAKDTVQPLTGSGGWVDTIFAVLTVIGVICLIGGIAYTVFGTLRNIENGNAG